jgi:acetyltransferase-like isoleucine patch superfamily enzyme
MISLPKLPGYVFLLMRKLIERLISAILRPLFKASGTNFRFSPWGRYSFSTISVGDDVYIGPGAYFSAKEGIMIGNKVLFGPQVSIYRRKPQYIQVRLLHG